MRELTWFLDIPKSAGNQYLLLEVKPVKRWIDNKPTDEITGYKYCCICPERDNGPYDVTISGDKKLEYTGGVMLVEFKGAVSKTYRKSDGSLGISHKADDIKLVKN